MPADAASAGLLARAYARVVVWLRWPIVLAWLAAAVAATLYLPGFGGGAVSPEGLIPKHAAATATEDRSTRDFGFPLLTELALVQRNPRGLSDAAQQRAAQRASTLDRGRTPAPGPFAFALPITNAQRALPFSRERSTTILTYLYPRPDANFGAMLVGARAYAAGLGGGRDDAVVGVTGAIPARVAQEQAITDALPAITIVTVALIAIVLALLMRSLLAPIVTLAAAGLAYLVALRAVAWAGQRTGISVPQELEPLVLVLLLGIVTDYSIFFLQEGRRQLGNGAGRLEAARAATARIGPIVLTAGSIVACGTLTLVVGTLGFFRALGPSLAVTAVVGMLATLTLIPALLAIAGPQIFRRAVHRARRDPTDADEAREHERGRVRRGARWLVRSRVAARLVVLAAIGLLAFAALGIRDARLGVTLTGGLPSDSSAGRATSAAQRGFAAGVISPTEVLIEGPGVARKTPELARLQTLMSHVAGVAGVVGPRDEAALGQQFASLSRSGNAARFLVVLDRDPFSAAAIDRVRRLQHALPSLLSQSGLAETRVGVAGESALSSETVAASRAALLRLAVAALAVNLVFLVVFLRSLIAPLYLLMASALALAATLGLTVTISQRVLGYPELTYYVPFAAAVLLLSLGSDYNIFVVGRIWDEARRRPVEDAVAYAAPKASLSISAAGFVMAMAFAVLAIVPLVPFRELALVMALGVLVDALLVRSLLAPALVTAFGEFGGWPGSRLTHWRTRRGVRRAPASAVPPDPLNRQGSARG